MSIGGHELMLYADNDRPLYQHKMAWFKNFALKKAKGIYHRPSAIKALANYHGKRSAQAYAKEFGTEGGKDWNKMFTMADRADAAIEWASEFETEYALGNFDTLLPAKYQKKSKVKDVDKTLRDASVISGNPHEVRLCPVGMQVQTLLFPAGWGKAKAKTWAKEHGFETKKFELSGEHIRSRQKPPSSFREGGFRTIPLGHSGVQAVVGCPR